MNVSKSSENTPTLSPTNEVKLRSTDSEETNYPRITFSTPNKVTVQVLEDGTNAKEEERKKLRKSIDEIPIKKRKEPSSFSNLIHRVTWGKFGTAAEQDKKEDKHKNDPETDNAKDEVDRPDQLLLAEKLDNISTDARNHDFQTALDANGGYWLSTEYVNEEGSKPSQLMQNAIIREERNSELDEQERSLVELLEEFRTGRMSALSKNEVLLLNNMKHEAEEVTRLHLSLYPDDFFETENFSTQRKFFNNVGDENEDKLYSQISNQLYKMHLNSASLL
ncbi:unnamed protein product, partial [Mesorhabditis belari]|uniref:Uncharacterized protein n=1 Tax=Mesorhabditis belari TaxID=2138241 RepID=A0AAF3FC23_9BILA